MKKLLLGSTALVAGGLIAAPAMAADPIKIGVGGYYQFFALAGSVEGVYAPDGTSIQYKGLQFQQEGEIHFIGQLPALVGKLPQAGHKSADTGPGLRHLLFKPEQQISSLAGSIHVLYRRINARGQLIAKVAQLVHGEFAALKTDLQGRIASQRLELRRQPWLISVNHFADLRQTDSCLPGMPTGIR